MGMYDDLREKQQLGGLSQVLWDRYERDRSMLSNHHTRKELNMSETTKPNAALAFHTT